MSRLIVYLFAALPLSAEGIESFLNRKEKIYFAGKSDSYSQTIIDIKSKQPDILIIDDTCLEADELSKFLGKINQCSWKRKILLYTSSNNSAYLRKIFDIGVKSFLYKKSSTVKLIEALETINITGVYIDDVIRSIILTKRVISNGLNEKLISLSKREKEIFDHIKNGMSNNEIKEELCISYRTVEIHKTNITRKLGLKSRRDLLKFIISKVIK